LTKAGKSKKNDISLSKSKDIKWCRSDFIEPPKKWIPTTQEPEGPHWIGFVPLNEKKHLGDNLYTYEEDNDKWHHHAMTPDGKYIYSLTEDLKV